MKRIPIVRPILCSLVGLSSLVSAQEFFEKQELTVPQRCALKLTESPVVVKLKLGPSQVKAIKDAENTYSEQITKINRNPVPNQSELIACDKRFANACLSVLTPDQKQKILKIGIADIGIEAFLDPSIAAQLNLTASQQQKIRGILVGVAKKEEDFSAIVAKAIEAIPEPKAGADRSKYDKACADTVASYEGERLRLLKGKALAERQVVEILANSQKQKWANLRTAG